MKHRINPFLRTIALATVLTGSCLAAAITYQWEGNTSGHLTDATNWVGGTAPAATGDAIQFGAAGTAGTSLILNTGFNLGYAGIVGGALQFNSGAPSYTISGSGLITLSTGSIVNNSGLLQVINNNLKRNTGNNITIGANGGILEFNGTYDIAASNLTQMSFGTTVGGAITFNGGLVNTGAAGTYGLTAPTNGMVVLGGTNTVLNGNITLSGSSTLKLISAGAVNTGQNIFIPNASNDTLWLASNTAVESFNIASATSLANKHNVILGTGSSGTAVTNQQIGTFAITSQNGYYFSKAGNVGSGTPTTEFTGTASFSNTATTGGAGRSHIISANGVDLVFSAATAFNYAVAPVYHAALVLDGNTTGSKITGSVIESDVGDVVLTKAGRGTWSLSGSNKYNGVTSVNNGTLKLDFNAAGAPSGDGTSAGNILYNGVAAAAVTLGGGNLSVAGKDGGASTQTFAGFNVQGNTGGNAITLRVGSGAGSSTAVTVTGFTVNTASSVNFDLEANTTFQNTAIAAAAFVGATAYFGSNEFARYDSSGFVAAAVDGNYTAAVANTGGGSTSGYYRLNGSLTRDASLDFAYKGLRLGNTADSDSLNLNGGTLTFSNSGLIYKGGSNNQYSIDNGTIRGNGVATDFNVVSGGTLTINADMGNNTGAAAFTKSGAGTVKVVGPKAFTGRVSVFEGVYEFDSIANGGLSSGLGASTNLAANLYLYGGTLKYTGGAASADRSFTVGARGAVIDASGSGALTWAPSVALTYSNTDNQIANTDTAASQDQSITFTGSSTADNTFGSSLALIADAGIGRTFVTKSGTGKWIFNQANTYTGGTKIDGGTLGITNASALGTIGAISFGGGTLQYGTGITQDLSQRIQHSTGAIGIDTNGNDVIFQSRLGETNTGGLIKSGAGTLTLANSNTYTGDTTVGAGTLVLADNAQLKFKPTTNGVTNSLNGTGTATLDGDFNIDLSGASLANGNSWTLVNVATLAETFSASFSVIGFTEVSNVWTKVDGSNTWTFSESTGVLGLVIAGGGNTYSSWIGGFSVGGQTGANDDFDADGLDNAVENVLGSDPSVSNTGLTQVSGTAASFKFRHNQSNTIATDVTKTYQWSTDLVEWKASGQTNTGGTAATIVPVTITDNIAPANDVIEVTVSVTGGPASKVFGRLVATKAP